jgi:hypothetical protein
MPPAVLLRKVTASDLPIFFAQTLDLVANQKDLASTKTCEVLCCVVLSRQPHHDRQCCATCAPAADKPDR